MNAWIALRSMRSTRRIANSRKLASALLADSHAFHYGLNLSRSAEIRMSSLYPLLNNFMAAGWVRDGWNDDVIPRRCYQLTPKGRKELPGAFDAEE